VVVVLSGGGAQAQTEEKESRERCGGGRRVLSLYIRAEGEGDSR
jgi:hypothetical protein